MPHRTPAALPHQAQKQQSPPLWADTSGNDLPALTFSVIYHSAHALVACSRCLQLRSRGKHVPRVRAAGESTAHPETGESSGQSARSGRQSAGQWVAGTQAGCEHGVPPRSPGSGPAQRLAVPWGAEGQGARCAAAVQGGRGREGGAPTPSRTKPQGARERQNPWLSPRARMRTLGTGEGTRKKPTSQGVRVLWAQRLLSLQKEEDPENPRPGSIRPKPETGPGPGELRWSRDSRLRASKSQ